MSTTRPCSPGDRGPDSEAAVADAPADPASGAPTARQVRRLSLSGASGIVPLARDYTREALHAWGWLPAESADRRAAAEDVLLVVSELVTNACLHAEGPDELWLSCDGKVLRIEVSDRWRGPARATDPAPRGAARRTRHVHRPAALPRLGCRTHAGGRRQEGLGGAGSARLAPARPRPPVGAAPGHGCRPAVLLSTVRTRAGSPRSARLLSSLGKAPGVP